MAGQRPSVWHLLQDLALSIPTSVLPAASKDYSSLPDKPAAFYSRLLRRGVQFLPKRIGEFLVMRERLRSPSELGQGSHDEPMAIFAKEIPTNYCFTTAERGSRIVIFVFIFSQSQQRITHKPAKAATMCRKPSLARESRESRNAQTALAAVWRHGLRENSTLEKGHVGGLGS
jgi:hypothetical protein